MHKGKPTFSLGAALFVSGCSAPATQSDEGEQSAQESESRLATVSEAGKLKVCTTGDYRPFTYLDPKSSEWSGIDIRHGQEPSEVPRRGT